MLITLALAPAPASADGVFNLYGGLFAVRSADSRVDDDVLLNNAGFLAFEIDDFNGGTFGADYHVGVGRYLEIGGGVGYYQQDVPSVYRDYVNENGFEIAQELSLKMVPISLTAKVFPFGRNQGVEPYVGGGVAFVNWKYSEVGEFVDFNNDYEVFRDRFVDDGWATLPVFLAGVRFPVGDVFRFGGEFRWQTGTADLDPSQGFAGERIDLGGYTYIATFGFRF
jgi:opacity protein-like surface antigen